MFPVIRIENHVFVGKVTAFAGEEFGENEMTFIAVAGGGGGEKILNGVLDNFLVETSRYKVSLKNHKTVYNKKKIESSKIF